MDVAKSQKTITSEAAAAAVDAALAKAAELERAINAAVVDKGGTLMAFRRSDGAALLSAEIAQKKAYTAASFGLPTSKWDKAFDGMSKSVREGITQQPKFAGFGDGLAITLDGEVIGAIGVSGASEEEDEICAQAGIAALGL